MQITDAQINDALVLDAASVRLTRDGYMVAVANIARTGVQCYRAAELGLADRDADAVVRVYRPADEVFAPDAMASLAHRPMTIDHPAEPVTAANWKRHAIGTTGGEVTRDGDTIRVPLTLMDAVAIADVQAGKRELSVGYSCELLFEDGISPEGERYDAVQRSIRGNHVAVCQTARGGPRLRIGDGAETRETIERLQGRVAALEAQLRDAAPTPDQLERLAEARSRLVADAARVADGAIDAAGRSAADLRRAAVATRLGDGVAAMSDAAVEGAFAALLASARVTDAARAVIVAGTVAAGDARRARAEARAARAAHFSRAHRGGVADAA
jgi:hypothetical protein